MPPSQVLEPLSQGTQLDTQSLHKQLCDTAGNSPPLPLRHIVIDGLDAQEFLQGQLTLDLAQLPAGQHQLTAWCNAKGRVWCLLRIWRTHDGFALLLPANQSEAFVKRLRMFVLRAKVNIEPDEQIVYAQLGEPHQAGTDTVERDGQRTLLHHDAHHRLILQDAVDSIDDATSAQIAAHYTGLRMLAGEAQIDATTQETFLPQSLNLGDLGGLHFNKGCYVGQEIVARVHYRGKAPQRLNYGLDLSAAQQNGKSVLASVDIPQGRLLQWVENIKPS